MEWIARNRNHIRRSGGSKRSAIRVFGKRFCRFFRLKRVKSFIWLFCSRWIEYKWRYRSCSKLCSMFRDSPTTPSRRYYRCAAWWRFAQVFVQRWIYPIWDCVYNRNHRQIHGIVDLTGGIYGFELVNYEELFPNSAIFDDGYLSPQIPAVPDFITIYEQVQASLRSLGFHESSEGKKISDKVFKRRLKDKLEAYFRNSWNQKRLENLYDLNDYNSRLLLESKKLSLESRYFIVEVTIILKETFSEDI